MSNKGEMRLSQDPQRDKLDIALDFLARIYSEVTGFPTITAARGKRFAVPIYTSVAEGYGEVDTISFRAPREVEPLPTDIALLNGRIIALYIAGHSMSPVLDPGDVVIVWYPQGSLTERHRRAGQLYVITDRKHVDHIGYATWRRGDVLLSNAGQAEMELTSKDILWAGLVIGTMRRSVVGGSMNNKLRSHE